jgi:effector-binding domain-containing protein
VKPLKKDIEYAIIGEISAYYKDNLSVSYWKVTKMTYPTPFFETCEPLPYVGKEFTLTMDQLSEAASAYGQIYAWLVQQKIEPSGSPFYRYKEFHSDGRITLEAGVPAEVEGTGDSGFTTGVLPEGRYLSILHTGDYSGLQPVTSFLMRWAEVRGMKFQADEEGGVSRWAGRLEWYLVDPKCEPDPAEWQTRVSILLA